MDTHLLNHFEMSVFNVEIELARIAEYAKKLDLNGKLRLLEFADQCLVLAQHTAC